MENLLMLLIATGSSSLCACTTHQQAHLEQPKPAIVVHQPRGEQGDFILCNDGRVLVFPAAHPKTCS